MKRILVLGGSYFIGRNLLSLIKEYKEVEIYVLNRGTRHKEEKYNYIIADRNDAESMKGKLGNKKYDIIFDISGTEKKHVHNIISEVRPENIGIYAFLSSSAVYADSNEIPYIEELSTIGKNKNWGSYGENKIECEEYIKKIHEENNMQYIILRPPYVYGEWNYIYRESYCFERIEENRPIFLPNDGDKKIQFIHVKDLCEGMFTLINNKDSYNNTYNIGNEIITFKQWAEKCMEAVQKNTHTINFHYEKYNLKSRDFFPFNDYNNVLDTKKISKYYEPQIKLKEGLINCYKWYLKNKNYIDYRDYEKIEQKFLKGEYK